MQEKAAYEYAYGYAYESMNDGINMKTILIRTDASQVIGSGHIFRTQALAQAVDIPVVASGGVSKLADIKDLAAVKVIDAVIAGRSLYEGTLDLAEAIETAQRYS